MRRSLFYLKKGDRVAVIAPASPQKAGEGELVDQGFELLREWGLEPVDHTLQQQVSGPLGYLAAPDGLRAEAFLKAFEASDIRALFCLRGGYGCARLLPHLSAQRLAGVSVPKTLVGMSDVTALMMYVGMHTRARLLHGPGVATRQFVEQPANREALRRALFEPEAPRSWPLHFLRAGKVSAPLVGGCLSIMVTSLGTPWQPDLRGRILFLEDVGEAAYRIDRMLTHLLQAGFFENCGGLVLGEFVGSGEPATLDAVFMDVLKGKTFPVARGLPCGHGEINETLPFENAILDGDVGHLRLKV